MKKNASLDLRQYKYFLILIEEQHFAKAAERLGITQPALSQQIRLIENLVGAELLVRGQRKIQLTDVGVVLFEQAKTILSQAEQAQFAIAAAAKGRIGRISISYVASAALSGVLPRIIYEFRLKSPDAQVLLQEIDMTEQAMMVAKGMIDIGFVRPPMQHLPTGVSKFDLFTEPMVAVLHRSHPQAKQTQIHLKDLQDETFICTHQKEGVGFYDITLRLCRKAGFTPKIEVFGSQTSILISMVAAGFGIALVPRSASFFKPSDIVFIPLADHSTKSVLAMIYKHNNRSPVVKAFLQTATSWSRQIAAKKKFTLS